MMVLIVVDLLLKLEVILATVIIIGSNDYSYNTLGTTTNATTNFTSNNNK